MINFVATFQDKKIKFSGIIKNNSNRPILVPKVQILAVREDRIIILDQGQSVVSRKSRKSSSPS